MRNEDEDEDEEELLMMLTSGNAITIVESDVNNCVLSRDIDDDGGGEDSYC